ncbi:MAG TPA: TrkA family potassium uptake protein [bacterium]|nr:TrkA family potassium uptake protein [bacterium]
MKVLIIGAGKVGGHLAGALAGSKHTVTIVDRDAAACAEVHTHGIEAVCGDGCSPEWLERAGVRQCDVLAAVTGVDENNLVAAFLARREYSVPRVIARVNHPANAWLFTPARGVDLAVSQAHLISTIIQEELSVGAMVTLASLRGGKVAVVEERVPPGSPLVDRPLRNVSLPPHAAIVAVLRAGEVLSPGPEIVFQEGDEIVAIAEIGAEPALAALIGGPGS